jgi:hypothetical protein
MQWLPIPKENQVMRTASVVARYPAGVLVPFGYENDCGGFGDVVLDVTAPKIRVERNDRFEDYTTITYGVRRWPTH